MQNNIEMNSSAIINNIVDNTYTLLDDLRLEALNLSLQLARLGTNSIEFTGQSTSLLTQLQLQMAYKTMSNPLIDNSYIILFDKNKVITPFIAGNTLNNFYGSFFMYKDLEIDEFKAVFINKYYNREILPPARIIRNGYEYNRMLLAQSFPCDPHIKPSGIILFTLNLDYVNHMVHNALSSSDGLVILYINDSQKVQVLSEYSENDMWNEEYKQELFSKHKLYGNGVHYIDIGNQKMLTCFTQSEDGSIIGILAQPTRVALDSIKKFKLIIFVQGIAIALVACFIAFYFTRRNVNSIWGIVDSFSGIDIDKHWKRDVYSYIQKAVSNMVNQNNALINYIEKQKFKLIESFIRKLLLGDILYMSDIIREQDSLGFSMCSDKYVVLLLVIDKPNEEFSQEVIIKKAGEYKQRIRNVLSNEFGSNIFFADIDTFSIASIICTDDDIRESLESVIADLAGVVPIHAYAGSIVEEVMDVPRAYKEAMYAYNNTDIASYPPLTWYYDMPAYTQLSNYNLLTEQRLINHIKAGNTYEVERMLLELYNSNITSNSRSANVVRCFAYDMYRLVCKVLDGQRGEDTNRILKELTIFLDVTMTNIEKIDAFFSEVRKVCIDVSNMYRQKSRSSSDLLCKRIMEYIKTSYTDAQLCVSSIAEKYGISDKYLSQLFKERTNQNISDYIEKIRIERACELLKQMDIDIKEIAFSVGYTSTHTFRAAFKRNMGVTPSQYRNGNEALLCSDYSLASPK